MKRIVKLIAVLSLVCFSNPAFAGFDLATSLIGGSSGSLDSIDGNTLANGDGAFVITSTDSYAYYLNASSGAAESSPDIIKPDSNAGTKRWILIEILAYGIDARDQDIINVGAIKLDSIQSDDGTDINVVLGSDAGDDFNIDSGVFICEGDLNKCTAADLVATTIDINGGTIDGAIIGGSDAVAGTFAAITATSFSNTEGAITNVGNIGLDSISSDDGTDIQIILGNDAGDDFDVNGNILNVSGDTDSIGMATTAVDNIFLNVVPTMTSGGAGATTAAMQIGGTMTGANGDLTFQSGTYLVTAITTQSNTETIVDISQLRLKEPSITKGTDTITNASTLHIVDAPTEASYNYSLWVESGNSFFVDKIGVNEPSAIFRVDVDGIINSQKYYWNEEFDYEVAAVQWEAGREQDAWVTAGTNYAAANVTFTGGAGGTLELKAAAADNDSAHSTGVGVWRIDANPICEMRVKIDNIATVHWAVGLVEGSYDSNAAYDDDIALIGQDTDQGAANIYFISNDAGAGVIFDDTGIDAVNGTYLTVMFDLSDTEQPRVWINRTEIAAGSISGTVQAGITVSAYMHVQNLAGGAIQRALTLDEMKCWQTRN